jgi:hypothetical protein
MDGAPKPNWLTRQLRTTGLVVVVLCVVAMIVGMLPGTEIYRDANDCFGQALGQLFSAHGGGHGRCEAHYVHVGTERAGGWWMILALLPVALGGLAVRRWPRIWVALLWPLGAFVLLVIGILLALDIEIFSLTHKVMLWPAKTVGIVLTAIGFIMLELFVEMLIVGIWRLYARRRAARDALPEARVV